MFYKKFDEDDKIDDYTYELIGGNSVKLKSKQLSLEFDNYEYELIEERIVEVELK